MMTTGVRFELTASKLTDSHSGQLSYPVIVSPTYFFYIFKTHFFIYFEEEAIATIMSTQHEVVRSPSATMRAGCTRFF